MASAQPTKPNPSRSTGVDRSASLIRFNSARVAPEKTTDGCESSPSPRPLSPSELHVNNRFFPAEQFPLQSPTASNCLHPTTRVAPTNEQNDAGRVVKISEYTVPENTPFEPVTPSKSLKKLHRYILVTPQTLFSLSIFAIASIGAVLIGFGIATSHRQSQLSYTCPVISYCPRNSSYTVRCNSTSEHCGCYNDEDVLIGCMQQRQYREGCYRPQECSAHYNLQCNESRYQCQCLDHYYYNGSTCVPLLTYSKACSMLNDTCDYLLSLTCLTGNVCTCDTSTAFWNGQYCERYRSVNSPCHPFKSPSGCALTFVCDNVTATCQCPVNAYFDGRACLTYSSYLEPCYDTLSCLTNTYLVCSWGVCQCDDLYFYWSVVNSTCIYPKQTQYNASCGYQTGCESDFGLRCINGRCACELNSYWTPGNYCDLQSQYNEQCSAAPCLVYTGLICPSNTSICTCPQYYFWDGFVCQYQRWHSSYCLYDNWCRMDLGLRCRNLTCTCSLCTTCFWDGVRCRDCPTSWQTVTSNGTVQPRVHCYLKVDSYVNWNESVVSCPTLATSFFGGSSHLIYIDDAQELQDVSIFATNDYYDIFIGHTNRYNYSQWFLSNGTVSPPIQWCSGVGTTFTSLTCARLLIGSACATSITCYGWTSRYICELD